MGWILRDFECECGEAYEDLIDSVEPHVAPCPKCGVVNEKIFTGAKIATYSIMSKEQQTAHLKKRAIDHSMKNFHGKK